MIIDTTTSIEELQNILNKIDDICIQIQNIKTTEIMKWDKVSLIHKIQNSVNQLYQNTRNI
jgi:hypothetical protein